MLLIRRGCGIHALRTGADGAGVTDVRFGMRHGGCGNKEVAATKQTGKYAIPRVRDACGDTRLSGVAFKDVGAASMLYELGAGHVRQELAKPTRL